MVLSVLEAELGLDGALDPAAAPLLGADVEPLAAPEDGALLSVEDDELELEGAGVLGFTVTDPLALVEPPAAGALLSVEDDAELELDGVLGVVALVEPDDELAPEPGVVRETARSPSLSQPSNPAPSARDTATAKVESLM